MESMKNFIERKNDDIYYLTYNDMHMNIKVKTFNNEVETFGKSFIDELRCNAC